MHFSDRFRLAEGWSTFFLLLVLLVTAATSISAARWTDGLGNLASAAVLGLVAGLLLAKSHFPAAIAHLFSSVYGLFTVSYLMGRLVEQPTWQDRLVQLSERSVTWLTKATSGGTSRDSLMFVVLLTCLFWILGHIGAWYTFRRPRLWRVLLPISLTMLVNLYVYTDPRISTRSTTSLTPFLIIYTLAALLYIVRTNVYLREVEWQSAKVNYDTEVRFDFVRSGTILATAALLVMVIAPGASASPYIGDMWKGITDTRDSVRTTVSRLFSSLDARGRGVGNPFGSRAVLGGPRDLGTEVLFDVQVGSVARYWQAMVYDRYTGSDWINTDDHKLLLPPGQAANTTKWGLRQEITQTVTIYLPSSTQIFAAPEPVRIPAFSTEATISFDQGRVTSVSAIHSQKTMRAGNVYQVVSSDSQADPVSLRSAGQDYPEWVERRYLQLPGSVTDRTRELAQEIVAGYDTVFDKAQAIEQYLRENLTYDLSVPAPPEGRDFVDFALFELKAGYCDYYATSFVVLARSVGIPARIVMGYAQGEFDEDARAYRVRANNGHSWPEVFFPRYGWLQFEPTVVIDPIDWPEPPEDSDSSSSAAGGGRSSPGDLFDPRDMIPDESDMSAGSLGYFPQPISRGPSPIAILFVGLVAAAALGTGAVYWATEKRGMSGLSVIEGAYTRMWRFASWLGVPGPPDQTPYERADALKTLVPEGRSGIERITDMYVVEKFGRGNGQEDTEEAGEEWQFLRPVLWRTWVDKKFRRFQRGNRSGWQDFYRSVLSKAGRNRSTGGKS
jgi:transglutaminase-like putative cysteine protease